MDEDGDDDGITVSLELPANDASTVTRAREAVIKHARAHGFRGEVQDRIGLAVSEACANCVLHAYDGSAATSTYRLDARMDGEDLVVVVADSGVGIAGDGDTREASKYAGLGWGLKLIRTLPSNAEVATALNQGTRVKMRFSASDVRQ